MIGCEKGKKLNGTGKKPNGTQNMGQGRGRGSSSRQRSMEEEMLRRNSE